MVAITTLTKLEGMFRHNQGFQNPNIEADIWDYQAFDIFDRMNPREFVGHMTKQLSIREKKLVSKYLKLLQNDDRMDEITYFAEEIGLLNDSRFKYGSDFFQNN